MAGAIFSSRTITITDRKGTSGTATATSTIPILYGCLIPLVLLNRTPPKTEPWLLWGRQPGKKYGGHSREVDTMRVQCRRIRGRGLLFLPAMAMVILLEEAMAEH